MMLASTDFSINSLSGLTNIQISINLCSIWTITPTPKASLKPLTPWVSNNATTKLNTSPFLSTTQTLGKTHSLMFLWKLYANLSGWTSKILSQAIEPSFSMLWPKLSPLIPCMFLFFLKVYATKLMLSLKFLGAVKTQMGLSYAKILELFMLPKILWWFGILKNAWFRHSSSLKTWLSHCLKQRYHVGLYAQIHISILEGISLIMLALCFGMMSTI